MLPLFQGGFAGGQALGKGGLGTIGNMSHLRGYAHNKGFAAAAAKRQQQAQQRAQQPVPPPPPRAPAPPKPDPDGWDWSKEKRGWNPGQDNSVQSDFWRKQQQQQGQQPAPDNPNTPAPPAPPAPSAPDPDNWDWSRETRGWNPNQDNSVQSDFWRKQQQAQQTNTGGYRPSGMGGRPGGYSRF